MIVSLMMDTPTSDDILPPLIQIAPGHENIITIGRQ